MRSAGPPLAVATRGLACRLPATAPPPEASTRGRVRLRDWVACFQRAPPLRGKRHFRVFLHDPLRGADVPRKEGLRVVDSLEGVRPPRLRVPSRPTGRETLGCGTRDGKSLAPRRTGAGIKRWGIKKCQNLILTSKLGNFAIADSTWSPNRSLKWPASPASISFHSPTSWARALRSRFCQKFPSS